MTDILIDPHGRRVSYLRVSVTDRCDFRCIYCMAEDMTFLPKAEVLTLEDEATLRVCHATQFHPSRQSKGGGRSVGGWFHEKRNSRLSQSTTSSRPLWVLRSVKR